MKRSEVSHSTRDTPTLTTRKSNWMFLVEICQKPSETLLQSDWCEQQVSTVAVDLFKANNALYQPL